MNLGFIGAGTVAQAIARRALAAGHMATLSSRGGGDALARTVLELGEGATSGSIAWAASQEVVILAVPWLQIEDALDNLPAWENRILIDATNPYTVFEPALVLADLQGASASTLVAERAPGARVVKAFNSIPMVRFDRDPYQDNLRRVLFLAGDDTEAKTEVGRLIESFGFAAVDLGGLEHGGLLQQPGGSLAGRDVFLAN